MIICAVLALLVSGCSGLVQAEQPKVTDWVSLSSGHSVGQTFVARYDGLSAIYFYLSTQTPGSGEIKLHLSAGPEEKSELAASNNSISIDEDLAPGFYGFSIPPQPHSSQKYYYARLEYIGTGEVKVGISQGETYSNGAFYSDDFGWNAQSAFQLAYARRFAFSGIGLEGLSWAGLLAVALFLFVLPGWGLFSLLWHGWGKFSWPQKLALAAALSLAIYPLLMLWTNLVGLHLGAFYAWFPPVVGLALLAWANRAVFSRKRVPDGSEPEKVDVSALLADIAFVLVLALVIFTRYWAIRGLQAPTGADSYQHTLIPQLIVDHGGLFTSWLPYSDLNTFTYHFGFHAATAVFYWITHMDMPTAVLWVGQFINILAVISLYPLAVKIGKSRWAGVAALLVAGLLGPMPMYFSNWGRYTQLTGQVILPVAVWLLWELHTSELDRPLKGSKGMLAIAVLGMAGLALAHYRILILAVLFLPVLWLLYARRGNIRRMFLRTLEIGLPAALLFLPWFIRVFGGSIMAIFARRISVPAVRAAEVDYPHSGSGGIAFFIPYVLLLLVVLAIGWGTWRRNKGAMLVTLWWFVLLIATYPFWLGLPGAGIISGDTISMAVYIPAGILLGAAVGWLDELRLSPAAFRTWKKTPGYAGLVLACTVAGILAVPSRLQDLKPFTFNMVNRPDMNAAGWIRVNTPADARFLVNSFPMFSNHTVTGSDAGFWLPLIAGRSTTVPPLSSGFESDPWEGYSSHITSLTLDIQAKGIGDPAVISELKDRNISYVYIGQREGTLFTSVPLFTYDQLNASPAFKLVYHQDRVWIYQVLK